MPTGYTAELHDGKDITFEEFVLACARNFGALILMRDDPKEAPIPTFEARTDYQEQMKAEAERDLAMLRSMTDEEKHVAHAAAVAEVERQIADDVEKAQAIRDRYEAMLRQVEEWRPPTEDHQGLKDFMVQQLNESIRFDCADAGKWRSLPESDVDLWWQQQVWAKERTIVRCHQDIAAEIERTQERNKWVDALRRSLEGVDA